jgi:hypothetical protein
LLSLPKALEYIQYLIDLAHEVKPFRGAGLYNCCRDGLPPNWTDFDGFEIWPCQIQTAYDGGPVSGSDTMIEPLHIPDEAHLVDFWSVYGHLHDGGLECITDTNTRKQAEAIVDLFIKENGDTMQVAMALREARDAPKH